MNYRVYIRHVTYTRSSPIKVDVKSSSTVGAAKLVLNNLGKYGLSYSNHENLGYYVTRVIRLK